MKHNYNLWPLLHIILYCLLLLTVFIAGLYYGLYSVRTYVELHTVSCAAAKGGSVYCGPAVYTGRGGGHQFIISANPDNRNDFE